jgi:hypothetical protein
MHDDQQALFPHNRVSFFIEYFIEFLDVIFNQIGMSLVQITDDNNKIRSYDLIQVLAQSKVEDEGDMFFANSA